jgi:hypothetical protein
MARWLRLRRRPSRRHRLVISSSVKPTLVGAVLVLLAVPGPAQAAKVITVKAPTVLQMTGSDIYCTVIKEGTGPAVACFHDPGGPSSNIRKGYAIAAFDRFVAVEPPGTTRPNKTVAQPSLKSYPARNGGSEHQAVVKLAEGDGAVVSGTRMVVVVEPAKGGGDAIGVIYLDGKGNPIPGTSTIGISNHFVTIVKVTGPGSTKVIYRHSVY